MYRFTPLFGCQDLPITAKTCKRNMHNHCVYVTYHMIQGVQKKKRTLLFSADSENKYSTLKNGTCWYSQEHGKTDDRCHLTCRPPGQSRYLLKADARCEPPSLHIHLQRKTARPHRFLASLSSSLSPFGSRAGLSAVQHLTRCT